MGFSGGGSNVLLPHTHDGTVSQDGGPLNFNNITQSQSAAGEVFYSDGVHLQQLVYPAVPAGETLTAAALSTAPSWVSAAGGGAAYELLGSTELGAPAADQTLTWASQSFADIAAVDIFFSCVTPGNLNGIQFQLNGITSASYNFDGTYVSGGTSSSINGSGLIRVYSPTNSQYFTGHIRVICMDPSNTSGSAPFLMYSGNITSVDGYSMYNFGGHLNGLNISASDGVRIYPPAGNLSTGSVITAFKLNRT